MRFAVCDDDIVFMEFFSKQIKKLFSNRDCALDVFSSPAELFKSESVYDIIFMDIEMPEMNGIEAAKHFSYSTSEIVFVTSNESFVFEAYNSTDSFGFVRKDKLETDLKEFIARYDRNSQRNTYLAVKNGTDVAKIKYSDIVYFEKVVNNVEIHTKNAKFSIRKTISEIEKQLTDSGFVRTHIGYIVNLDYISLINSKEIVLSNGETVPLSRKNIKSVKEKFLKRNVTLNE